MDLSFPFPPPTDEAALPAADLAQLVALFAQVHAASATAHAQATLDEVTLDQVTGDRPAEPLAPADGAFNAGMAARLTAWQQE